MIKIPLVVLNGTLGSGKTTLVKRLLKSPGYSGSFLIENEFASVNIDREAIADEHDDEIYEISGSCICCSTGEELEAALDSVVARGWDKPVILEATGMANSALLLRRLFLNPRFAGHFEIASTVLMIDGAEEQADSLSQDLMMEARLADLIIINKADLADSEAQALKHIMADLNPNAAVVCAVRADIDLNLVSGRTSNVEVAFAKVYTEIPDVQLDDTTYAVLELDGPLEPELVKRALRPSSFPEGASLRRAKGFFTDHSGSQWQVEATASHIELTMVLKPKSPVLVAIGPGITKQILKDVLT